MKQFFGLIGMVIGMRLLFVVACAISVIAGANNVEPVRQIMIFPSGTMWLFAVLSGVLFGMLLRNKIEIKHWSCVAIGIALVVAMFVNFNGLWYAVYDPIWEAVGNAVIQPFFKGLSAEAVATGRVGFEMMIFINNFSVGNLLISYLIAMLTVEGKNLYLRREQRKIAARN